MGGVQQFSQVFLDPAIINQYWPAIAGGLRVTLGLAAAIVVVGISAGLLLACLRCAGIRSLNALIIAFADIWRALPPLVVILIFYFGLPGIGITFSAWMVLFLTLSLVLAAFSEEIFWAGIRAVDRGQWEAASASGMRAITVLIWIVLPQAMRMSMPSLTNRAIAITKMTALGTVIGVPEILYQASSAQSFSGSATPLTMGALAYVALFLPFVILGRWLESRMNWRRH
ncbi:amino acid ABC transporter permease [Salinicola corii]|uniref:Amino acid ABC transporter permease n=1 Tax=Salinicola corii TaxID=2606937 RepID=A0A640WFL0_9GAMM|nr:amino acid ABC transporter permease [Salinicola corii]KAA0019048.1 amino acid ABC transporter permease [Salinicola corii]